MPPKKPTVRVGYVDFVHYKHDFASNLVIVGTNIVSNSDRDTFRLKTKAGSPPIEEQIRARPKWAGIAAAAAAKRDGEQLPPPPEPQPACQRELKALPRAPAPEQQRSSLKPEFFMHSEHSVRDDSESRKLGSAHSARDVSYTAASKNLEAVISILSVPPFRRSTLGLKPCLRLVRSVVQDSAS